MIQFYRYYQDMFKTQLQKVTLAYFIKYLLLSIGALFIIQTALVIVDAKQNGFTTLSLHTASTDISKNPQNTAFIFAAKDNYLGSISLPLTVHQNGEIILKLKEKDADSSFYQGKYNTRAFQLLPSYPFGFPVIADSKDKQYEVVFEPSIDTSKATVSLRASDIITRYTYPKTVILHNKKLFLTFFVQKYLSTVSFFTIVIVLLLAFLIINPKRTLRRAHYISKKILAELEKEEIYKTCVFLVVFAGFLYWSLVQMDFFGALLWFLGLCLVYLLTLKFNEKILFLVPLFFFGVSIIALITKQATFATTAGSLVWVFLLAGIVQYFLNILVHFFKQKDTSYLRDLIYKVFFAVSFIALIIALFDKTYILGGDDSRIYFLYPQLFLQNFASTGGLDGGVSSIINLLPTQSIMPFTIFLIFVKTFFFHMNLQMSLFILNIIGGIISFYVLLQYLIPGKHFEYFVARIIACLFYVFSIFNFYTLFNSLLIAQFLISLFPLSMYLYIKGIKENKYYLLGFCAIIWSIFSFVLISLPWFAGGFIAFIPLIIWLFWKEKRKFIIMNIFFGILLLLLNGFWISTISQSGVSNTSIAKDSSIVSTEFRNENSQGIIGTAKINKVFFPLMNLYHYDIQNNFHWPYLPIFNSWYLNFLILNSTFTIFIFWIGIKIQNNQLRKVYLACACSLLISIYFFTVNIGDAGINLFVFLNNHVPGFVMFRNMYDKFGYAMALSFSLLLFVSLIYFLTSKIRLIYKRIVVVFFLFVITLNALPFLVGYFYSLPIWTTTNTYPTVTALNHDYINLVTYIREQSNPSRYLWTPLNSGNISQIQDEKEQKHYYNGVSPLMLLSGKNDYSGLLSFGDFGSEIKNDILHRRYKDLGQLYQQYNVKYIIVNNTITKDIKQSYICGDNICNAQDEKYKKYFLGKKIKDFGSRYSLYEINHQFFNDKMYLTTDAMLFPNEKQKNISYNRISLNEYTIHISHLQKDEELVSLNPYFSNWQLFAQDATALPNSNHTKIFNYANSWTLNKNALTSKLPKTDYIKNADGSIDMNIRLRFIKNNLDFIFNVVAVITYAAIILYGLIMLLKYKLKRKNKV